MRLTKLTLVAALGVSACFSSNAQFALSEGVFESDSLEIHVVLLDASKGVAAASVAVSQGSCSGSVAGIGAIDAKKLTFAPYNKVQREEACSVSIEFDSQWRQVKVTDNGQCVLYHGASCSWTGQGASKK